MAAERLLRILGQMAAAGWSPSSPGPLCRVAAEVVHMTGAGIMVLDEGVPKASLCTSGTVSTLIEDLQYSLGEGPCVDAHRLGTVVSEPDLAAATRWPAFSPAVIDAGARAVFAFPVRIGAARIGALDLYRDRAGPLSDDQHADALVLADVIARTLLAMQADAIPGSPEANLEVDFHASVHQAAGMVSVQLGISVGDALVRLRAHAFRADRMLAEIAEDVITRRLSFGGLDE